MAVGTHHTQVGSICGACGQMWPCQVAEWEVEGARLKAQVARLGTKLEQARGVIEELFSLADRVPAEVRQRVEITLKGAQEEGG